MSRAGRRFLAALGGCCVVAMVPGAHAATPVAPGLSSWWLRIDEQVAVGIERPDDALAALQVLQAASALPGTPPAARRAVLLGRGLVAATVGRRSDAEDAAAAIDAFGPSDPLAGADAQLVRATLADATGEPQKAALLAGAAWATYQTACALAEARPCDPASPWRAGTLLSRLSAQQGRHAVARDHALAAAEGARLSGDSARQAIALATAADQSAAQGEADAAQRLFAQAQRLARLHGSAQLRARIAVYETRLLAGRGDHDGARRAAEAGAALAQQAGLPRLQAVLLANLSDAFVKLGRPREALATVERALPAVRRVGDRRTERVLLANAALARIGLGDMAAAHRALAELLAGFADAGAKADQATLLREFADAFAAAGDHRGALELHHRERRLAAELVAANRTTALAELRQRFDLDAQSKRLDEMARDDALATTQLANRSAVRRLWGASAVASLLAAALVALLYRRVRRLNGELARNQASLRVQSERDPLTGLANRRLLHERLGAATGAFRGTLLMLDIDHFKLVNDARGHGAGDAVLIEVARRLSACVRADDLVVRWGGEEFLVYAPGLGFDAARELAGRLLQAVGSEPVRLAEGSDALVVTVSIGWASFPLASGAHAGAARLAPLSLDRSINLTDMALYTAKAQGRNQTLGIVAVAAPPDGAAGGAADAVRAVESDFDRARHEGRVLLDMQPGPAAKPHRALGPVVVAAPASAVAATIGR